MSFLEEIKVSLKSNPNLTEEIRNKLFNLVVIFNKKMPNVNLSKLNENLKTVKFGKISRLERKGTYYYDVFKNEILISREIESNYKEFGARKIDKIIKNNLENIIINNILENKEIITVKTLKKEKHLYAFLVFF